MIEHGSAGQSARPPKPLLQNGNRFQRSCAQLLQRHPAVVLTRPHSGRLKFDPGTGLAATGEFASIRLHSVDPAVPSRDHRRYYTRLALGGFRTGTQAAMKFTSGFSADGPVATISQRGLLAVGVTAPTPTYPPSSRTRQSHQGFSSFG